MLSFYVKKIDIIPHCMTDAFISQLKVKYLGQKYILKYLSQI